MKTRLGQTLQKARKHQKLTLAHCANSTKIKPKYLEALEAGDFSIFTSQTQAAGFVGIYARQLKLDQEKCLALYRQEAEPTLAARTVQKEQTWTNKASSIINQRILKFGFGIVVVGVLILFIGSQINSTLAAPSLAISEPIEAKADFSGEVFVAGNSFRISGITQTNTIVRVNNEIIEVDPDFSFSTKEIPFSSSVLTVNITATNQLGRESKIELRVKSGTANTLQIDQMKASIEVSTQETDLLIRADGKIQFNERVFPGDVIIISAERNLQIESENPDSLMLTINDVQYPINSRDQIWDLIDNTIVTN